MFDRRVARHYLTDKALSAWLGAVAHRNGSDGMVVADADGLLIGGGIEGEVAEELAAVAVASRMTPDETFRGHPLTVTRFAWETETLYVAALGDRARCGAANEESIAGVRRILSEGGRAPA